MPFGRVCKGCPVCQVVLVSDMLNPHSQPHSPPLIYLLPHNLILPSPLLIYPPSSSLTTSFSPLLIYPPSSSLTTSFSPLLIYPPPPPSQPHSPLSSSIPPPPPSQPHSPLSSSIPPPPPSQPHSPLSSSIPPPPPSPSPSPSQMALKASGADRGSSESVDDEEDGHQNSSGHSNMTAQKQLSPISLKDFQERAL